MKLLGLPLVVLLAASCGGAAATAVKTSPPPAPAVRWSNTLPGQTASATIDLVQNVLDFAPGAASAVHVHITPNLATVLQGQITIKTADGDRSGMPGTGLVEPLNRPVQAVNQGSTETMVAVAFSVPHGAKPTSSVAGQPVPAVPNKTLYTYTLDSPTLTGDYSIVQLVLDFGPGATTAEQRVGGPGILTVVSGQVTLVADGKPMDYAAGESFAELPAQTLRLSNPRSSALVVASYLLPDGAKLATNV